MIDLVSGLFTDPARFLVLAPGILAGSALLLGFLEVLLFALLSLLLSWREARPKVPHFAVLLFAIFMLGVSPSFPSTSDVGGQEVPTIQTRFTKIFSTDSLRVGDPALSPDGRWLAFFGHKGNTDIFVVSTQGGDPIRLTNGQHLNQTPQWFPSGNRIAFLSDQVAEGEGLLLYVMSIPIDPETGRASGPVRQVSLEPAREPVISPDGRWIAYGTYIGHGHLKVIPAQGGIARTLFEPDDTTGSPRDPEWSSDSDHVYFTSRVPGSEATRLMRVGLEGGDAEEISRIQGSVEAIAPDARYLVRDLGEGSGQGPALELLTPHGQILGRVPLHRNMVRGADAFTFDGAGTAATVRDPGAAVFVAPLLDGPARQISEGQAYEFPIGWTPDSRKVFYQTRLNGREAVLLSPVEGGPTLEIPLPEGEVEPVAPSADGEYIAYALGAEADTGRTAIIRRISDGETRVLTHAFLRGLDPGRQVRQMVGPGGAPTDRGEFLYLERHGDRVELRASPPEGPSRVIRSVAPGPGIGKRHSLGVHGDWVAYAERKGESESTLFLSIGEGEPPRALATVPGGIEGISWSHDRRWIVAGHWGAEFGLLLVGVTPEGTPASEPRILETEAWIPLGGAQWLPGNETVALFGMAKEGGGNRLWLIPIREGEPAVPVTLGDRGTWATSISPDGRHVAFEQAVGRSSSSIWVLDYGAFLREQGLVGR